MNWDNADKHEAPYVQEFAIFGIAQRGCLSRIHLFRGLAKPRFGTLMLVWMFIANFGTR